MRRTRIRRPTRRAAVVVLAVALSWLAPSAPPTGAMADQHTPAEATHTDRTARLSAAYPHLTGPQFLAIFDEMVPAGTQPLSVAPAITGDNAADERIRTLARARGYRLRPVSTGALVGIDGTTLHPHAADALAQMKSAAVAAGNPIVAVSGHRSVSVQRSIFLGRLWVSPAQIASGAADGAVDSALAWVAPPGYSKHQTGHAVDLAQPGGSLSGFESSPAFAWLSADNYRNARRFGFVPSYPPDGGLQGPEPEPWEYVYVGTDRSRAQSPFGAIDSVVADGIGKVRVSGWAINASAPTQPVEIHVYVGGPVGTPGAVGTNLGPADRIRNDVGALYTDAGSRHGFDATANSGSLQGTVPACIYAINSGPGSTTRLGCPMVALASGSPVGALDSATGGPMTLQARGWAADPDGTAPTRVHLRLDGVLAADILADGHRPDVAAAFPHLGANRGFNHVIESGPGWRTMCAIAINDPGSLGSNTTLGCLRRWVEDPDAAFVDLLASDPFHASIAALAERGVISGFDDSTFRPARAVSRQAAVAFLHRIAGGSAETSESTESSEADVVSGSTRSVTLDQTHEQRDFVDVGEEHPFATEIRWAAQSGIVEGYDDGTFRPAQPLSRQAFAAMLSRHLDHLGVDLPDPDGPTFVDVGEDNPFATAIAQMAELGITTGFDDDTFRPGAVVSRQAAAAFLHRLPEHATTSPTS